MFVCSIGPSSYRFLFKQPKEEHPEYKTLKFFPNIESDLCAVKQVKSAV